MIKEIKELENMFLFGSYEEKIEKLKDLKEILTNKNHNELLAIFKIVCIGLYETAKYIKQVEYVNILYGCLDDEQKNLLYQYVTSNNFWNSLNQNRKDKFFYLIERLCQQNCTSILNELNLPNEIKIFLVQRHLYNELCDNNINTQNIIDFIHESNDLGIIRSILIELEKYYLNIKNEKLSFSSFKIEKLSNCKRQLISTFKNK